MNGLPCPLRWLSLLTLFLPLVACGAASTIAQKPVTLSQESQVVAALKQAKRVLWVAAHPDDETSSSALLARAKDLSGTLYMVSLTSGENSDILWGGLRRGSEIGAARAKLFAQSAAIFRADGYEIGPFVNGPVSSTELNGRTADAPHEDWPSAATSDHVIAKWNREGDTLGYLTSVLRRLKPEVVITMDYHCGVSGHDEHLAVSRLLMQAIPLAADGTVYSQASASWKVGYVIFTASVIPQLVACNYCKCEGTDLPEPIEQVLSVEPSSRYGLTYFGVACMVARMYENTMKSKGRSEQEIRLGCERADGAALRAMRIGNVDPQFSQAFRVRYLP